MSRQVAALVYSRKVGSLLRKSVLLFFAERSDKDGKEIFASKSRIAREVECDKRSVDRTVNQFLAEGLLIKVGKRRTSTGFVYVYNIVLATVRELPLSLAGSCSSEMTDGFEPEAPGTSATSPPVQSHPNLPVTEIEPSVSFDDRGSQAKAPTSKKKHSAKNAKAPSLKPISNEWSANSEGASFAQQLGFSEMETNNEENKFRDFHTAKGTKNRDWDAAWRLWIRKANELRRIAGTGDSSSLHLKQKSSLAGILARSRTRDQI